MKLADVPRYIAPSADEIERIKDEAMNGRSGEVMDYVTMYLRDHCTDDFARQLIATAEAVIENDRAKRS